MQRYEKGRQDQSSTKSPSEPEHFFKPFFLQRRILLSHHPTPTSPAH
jgi:hypothetical protein